MTTIELQITRLGSSVVTQAYQADELIVGRSARADIVVSDGSVSRRHARLSCRDGHWFVEDLGSRFGTQLNGTPLLGTELLRPGDQIQLGDTVVRVEQVEGIAPVEAVRVAPLSDNQTIFSVLKPASERAMFVTALAGCLDLATGRMALANAGHNLPYLLRGNGVVELVHAANGLALGVMEDAAFPLTELAIDPGDALLAYTDGVCDAIDPGGIAFGIEGLERQLRLLVRQRPDLIVNSLFEAVEAHAGDAPQEDDITIVAIRYDGPQDETMA